VGARLREAREAQGLAIDDVAQQLKFAPRQIESLENERFDRLPGPTIARGMVRNYARLLRIDAEPLVERMTPQVDKAPDPTLLAERFRQEVPFSEGGKRSSLTYAAFSVGLLVLVGAVAYEWQQEKAAPQFVAPAQERPQPQPLERQPVAAPQRPTVQAPPAAPEAKVVEEKKFEGKKVEEKQELALLDDKAPAGGLHSIVLRCQAESWIEVRDGSGRTLTAALNPAGSERVVRGRPPFELVIGNAASVRLIYDGKPVDLRPHTRVEVARLTLK
jgi:cytoskeleton protein RodZ